MSDVVAVNGFRYRVVKPLGQPGYIAQAYLAEALDFEGQVVIKTVSPVSTLPLSQAIKQLQSEAMVLAKLNLAEDSHWPAHGNARDRALRARATVETRNIIAGLDHGQIMGQDNSRFEEQYGLIQELAPGEVEPSLIQTQDDELRALLLAHRIARVVDIAHRCDIALKDFMPETKIDRLRAGWENGRLANFKVIDWNISGASAETANDLVFLGGIVFALLTGRFLSLEKRGEHYHFPLIDTATLVGPAWNNLSAGTHFLVRRLINPLPTLRPSSAHLIADEIQWLIGLLRQQDLSRERWRSLLYEHYDNPVRVLTIVETSRQYDLPPSLRSELDHEATRAAQILQAGEHRLLQDIEDNLRYGAFNEATRQIKEALSKLDPGAETARQAQYRARQAELCLALAAAGEDVRRTPTYRQVAQGVDALIARNWPAARDELLLIAAPWDAQPAARALQAVAVWRLSESELEREIAAQAVGVDDSLLTVEQMRAREQLRLDALEQIEARLRKWLQFAPFEVELRSQVYRLEEVIALRRQALDKLLTAYSLLGKEDFNGSLALAEQLHKQMPDDPRIAALANETHARQNVVRQIADVRICLEKGEYEYAYRILDELAPQHPDNLTKRAWRQIATDYQLAFVREQVQEGRQFVAHVQDELGRAAKQLETKKRKYADLISDTEQLGLSQPERELLGSLRDILNALTRVQTPTDKAHAKIPARQLERLDELQRETQGLIRGLIEGKIDQAYEALHRFNRKTHLEVIGLLNVLTPWSQESDLQSQVKQVETRAEQLRNLLVGTDQALQTDEDKRILDAFRNVSTDPAVYEATREAVKSWVTIAEQIQVSPREMQALPELPPDWPGGEHWAARLRQRIGAAWLELAEQETGQGEWSKAVAAYAHAVHWGFDLSESHKGVQREVALLSEVQTHLPEMKTLEEIQAAWSNLRILKLTVAGVDSLRKDVLTAWEYALWAELPAAGEANAKLVDVPMLERLIARWLDAYTNTQNPTFYQATQRIKTAVEVVRAHEQWNDIQSWLKYARPDREKLDSLAEGEDPLAAWGLYWRENWKEARKRHYGTAEQQFRAALNAGELPSARSAMASLNSLVEPGVTPLEQVVEWQTRLSAWEEVEQLIAKTEAALNRLEAEITDQHVEDAQRAAREAQAHLLPHESAIKAWAEYIAASQQRQRALDVIRNQTTWAVRLAALLAESKSLKPLAPETPNDLWAQRLNDWQERLTALNERVQRALSDDGAQLMHTTVTQCQAMTEQVAAGSLEESTAHKTAVWLWQLLWWEETNAGATGQAVLEGSNWLKQLNDALRERRRQLIGEYTGIGPRQYEAVQQELVILYQAVRSLRNRPPELNLPGVGDHWQPNTLVLLETAKEDWQGLRNQWVGLWSRPLTWTTAKEAREALSERADAVQRLISKEQLAETSPLVLVKAALDTAHKFAQALAETQALEQGQLTEMAENLKALNGIRWNNDADGLVTPERREDWFNAERQRLNDRFRADVTQAAKDCLEGSNTGKWEEQLRKQLRTLAKEDRDLHTLVLSAVLAAARDVSGNYCTKGNIARARDVWHAVARVFDELKKEADRELAGLKKHGGNRGRWFHSLWILPSIAGALVIGYATLTCGITRRDCRFPDCAFDADQCCTCSVEQACCDCNVMDLSQCALIPCVVDEAHCCVPTTSTPIPTSTPTATPTPSPTPTPTASPTPTLTPTPTATPTPTETPSPTPVPCDEINFEILASPEPVQQPAGSVSFTWLVRNEVDIAQKPFCAWDSSIPLQARENRGGSYQVDVRLVENNVYELTINIVEEEMVGLHKYTWRLLVPATNAMGEQKLTAQVTIIAPTSTPTSTPTPTSCPDGCLRTEHRCTEFDDRGDCKAYEEVCMETGPKCP